MKIRIKGNSIRIRVTKSEVEEFCSVGYLEEKTYFCSGEFTYAIRLEDNLIEFSSELKDNFIVFKVPRKMAKNWNTNENVGFSNTLTFDNGNTLSLLLEKDFTCLENREEDQSDNYPNPKLESKNNEA